MNEIMKLTPLAVVLAIVALAIGFMLQRGMALGTWLFAAFLLGHGLVHVMFAVPPPTQPGAPGAEFAFDATRSWIVTGHLADLSVVRMLVVALVAVTIVGYSLAALSTVGLIVPTTLWPALVVAATTSSAALMVIGLSPALVLGIAIDLALFALAYSSACRPGILPS